MASTAVAEPVVAAEGAGSLEVEMFLEDAQLK
jgi:hypothetical protein